MNITKTHIDRIQGIDTPRKAFNALRALGYSKTDMQMTRMATTYGIDGSYSSRLTVSIPRHGEAFIIMDRTRSGDDDGWGFISSALTVGNLKDGANAKLQRMIERMLDMGIIEEGQDLNMLQLAVALVTAFHRAEQLNAN